MAYRHGVYNQEQDTSLVTPVQSTAGLQVIFGTAPIHLASDPAAAVNKPVLVYSMAEAQRTLGYADDFDAFTLCQSMSACFQVFNVAPLVFVNVLDPSNAAHIKDNAADEYQVADLQVVYPEKYALLNTLTVKNGASTLVYLTDYLAVHQADGTVLITLISDAAKTAATLTISSKSLNPSGVKNTDIVGGLDAATGQETGLELVRQVYPRLGLVPGILLAPGWSHDPVVAAAIQAKTEEINGNFKCSCILDIPTSGAAAAKTYTEAKAAKEAIGAVTAHGIAVWPKALVGTKQYYMSAVAAALTAYTDAGNGDVPYESPSNKALKITGLCLEDGTEVVLDQEQGNLLNSQGIVTAINVNGFRLWGNNTAAYPATTDPKDRWWAVRRFFDWDGNNFLLTYFQKVDSPANKRLIQSIVDSQNITGNGYVAREYCAGYRMEFLAEENQVTDLLNGILRVHTYLAPYVPSEVIENTMEYDVEALQEALGGE